MLKALLKKEIRELFSLMFQSGKKRKKRKALSTVMYALLLVFAAGVMYAAFFGLSQALYAPLAELELEWLYFAMLGSLALMLGIFGSAFSTYAALYRSKDNEMLLAMPIPPGTILLSRMCACFLTTLFFESIVLVPAWVVSLLKTAQPGAAEIVSGPLLLLLLSFVGLSVSCVLGWVIALIAARLRNKSIVTAVLSLAALGAYYYLVGQSDQLMEILIRYRLDIGAWMQNTLPPLYHLGLAGTGDIRSLLLTATVSLGVFALVYWILSRSFIRLATAKRGAARKRYREKEHRVSTQSGALLRREFLRLKASATYLLNCSLGTFFMLGGAVMLAVKGETVRQMLPLLPRMTQAAPLAAAAIAALVSGMNDLTAPSISLESKTLWMLQSLPVRAQRIFRAKIALHVIMTLPAALILYACAAVVLRMDVLSAALCAVMLCALVCFFAVSGLVIGLKMPVMNWKNESVAVKQGFGVMLAMLVNWGSVLALGGLYVLAKEFMSNTAFLAVAIALTAAASVLLCRWLNIRGAKAFERL